jgi:hypothetical protein
LPGLFFSINSDTKKQFYETYSIACCDRPMLSIITQPTFKKIKGKQALG